MTQLLDITIGSMLEEMADKHPDHQAIKYIETNYERTYKQLNEEADLYARALLGMGLKKGDHFAVWATNYPEWLIAFFAAAKAGIVLVTVNTNYKIHEINYLLSQSDARALLICDGLLDIDSTAIMYELCPELKTSSFGNLNSAKLPKLKYVMSIDGAKDGIIQFKDILKFADNISVLEYNAHKDALNCHDIINIQYTSGTTGFPKGVMLTHYNILNNGKTIGDNMNFTHKDRLCITVPFFHCFGLVLSVLVCLTHASTMVPVYYYSALKVMKAISQEKCTALNGVPTMFIGILEHKNFKDYDFSHMRTGIMAGSPCPIKVMRTAMKEMNMTEITIVYGQTEASPGCTQTNVFDSAEHRATTVGRVMQGIEAKIIDPETKKTLPPNTQGEFCARGYNIMKGYYNMPAATDQAIDEDGWLHTGDLAQVDEDGYYKITGRLKDMIIRGGENIYPKEIEEFLYNHPKVKDVQVIGVPSEQYGEEVMAWIILKEGETISKQELKDYVKANMARHKVPKYIKFVDSFPMTASGKIQKFKMRETSTAELNLKTASNIETA